MRFLNYLTEYRVIDSSIKGAIYMEKPGDYVWIFHPGIGGLWYLKPDGNLFKNKTKVGKVTFNQQPADHTFYHNTLIWGEGVKFHDSKTQNNLLDDLEHTIVVQGRVRRNTIIIGISRGEKLDNLAVDAIYDCIPEQKL